MCFVDEKQYEEFQRKSRLEKLKEIIVQRRSEVQQQYNTDSHLKVAISFHSYKFFSLLFLLEYFPNVITLGDPEGVQRRANRKAQSRVRSTSRYATYSRVDHLMFQYLLVKYSMQYSRKNLQFLCLQILPHNISLSGRIYGYPRCFFRYLYDQANSFFII